MKITLFSFFMMLSLQCSAMNNDPFGNTAHVARKEAKKIMRIRFEKPLEQAKQTKQETKKEK